MPFVTPPQQIFFGIRILIWIAEKIAGRYLLPPRLLAWYPKALFSSGILESMITSSDGNVTRRMLKLVRLQVSIKVSCPFCIDMNSDEAEKYSIGEAELSALQERVSVEEVSSFSERERSAILFTRALCKTPVSIGDELLDAVKKHFTEREIVVLSSTAAQVNYWARLLQGLGVGSAPSKNNDYCR